MPDFILPDEADHCPHCGAVLREPPDCCDKMRVEHAWTFQHRYPQDDDLPTEAEIQAALDFGKTAEQHLRDGM